LIEGEIREGPAGSAIAGSVRLVPTQRAGLIFLLILMTALAPIGVISRQLGLALLPLIFPAYALATAWLVARREGRLTIALLESLR